MGRIQSAQLPFVLFEAGIKLLSCSRRYSFPILSSDLIHLCSTPIFKAKLSNSERGEFWFLRVAMILPPKISLVIVDICCKR